MTRVDSITVERVAGERGWVYEVRVKGIDADDFAEECSYHDPSFEADAGTTLKIIYEDLQQPSNVLQFPRQYGDVGIGKTSTDYSMEADA